MRERLCNTWDEVERLFRILRESRHVTYDTETSGLDWRKNHVVGYVITPLNEGSYYVPVRHLGGGNLPGCRVPSDPEGWRGDLHPFEIEFAKIAGETYRHWVGHYLLFDMRFSFRHGITLYGTHEDTGINDPLIEENQKTYSLANCAKRHGVQDKKGDDLYRYIADLVGVDPGLGRKLMEHYWRTDASKPVVWEYAAGDGVTTEELWAAQQPILDEDKEVGVRDADTGAERIVDHSRRKVWGVECRLIKTLFRMTTGGIRIDEGKLDQVDAYFQTLADKASSDFPKGFRSNAPSDLKVYLGLSDDDTTWPRHPVNAQQRKKAEREGTVARGSLIFNEAVLKKNPQGRKILETRKLLHARSAFTQPMINRHLFRGRVFCDFAQLASDDYGTISGRLSSYDPNLQQVPKRDKTIAPEYRKCFLPDEGHIWYDNDYKQQEYVVFTDYTGDPVMSAGYRQDPPVDLHQSVANMLGVERDPTAKRMNLAMLYGMGIATMAERLGCSEAQARAWQAEYFGKFKSVRPFLKGAEARAKRRGYVRTYLGRRRHFDRGFEHKAANGIIQGSSADITKQKMVEVDEYFENEGDLFRLMLQCHDSLSWTGPEDRPDINEEALRIMKNFGPGQPIEMSIPMGVDTGTGHNWSEAVWGRED